MNNDHTLLGFYQSFNLNFALLLMMLAGFLVSQVQAQNISTIVSDGRLYVKPTTGLSALVFRLDPDVREAIGIDKYPYDIQHHYGVEFGLVHAGYRLGLKLGYGQNVDDEEILRFDVARSIYTGIVFSPEIVAFNGLEGDMNIGISTNLEAGYYHYKGRYIDWLSLANADREEIEEYEGFDDIPRLTTTLHTFGVGGGFNLTMSWILKEQHMLLGIAPANIVVTPRSIGWHGAVSMQMIF